MERLRFVYALVDPVTGGVRYVGVTVNLNRRLARHLAPSSTDNCHKANWVRSLRDRGLRPEVRVLETVFGEAWKRAEMRWIDHYLTLGSDLTNATKGGDGVRRRYPVSAETRARLSASGKGKRKPRGHGQRVSAAMKGRTPTAAIQARTAKSARGELRLRTATRRKLGEAARRTYAKRVVCDHCGREMPAVRLAQHLAFAEQRGETWIT